MKQETRRPTKRDPYSQEFRVKKTSGLLEFLLENMTGVSRNNVKGLLKRRQVAVDGAPVAQFDFEVVPGDIVMIGKERLERRSTRPTIDIIYEDEEMIAINKPHGLLSIASDKEKEATAYRQVTAHVRTTDPKARVFVVHRIDQDTSGVLLFVKNNRLRDLWQDQWNDLVTKRGYYAVVVGQPSSDKDTLRHYLKETTTHMMYVSDRPGDGQLAVTHYQVMKTNSQYSLLDVTIDSGRKNQIRVQLRHIGHPIVGDDKYDTLLNPIDRLGLHAYHLSLKHPETGRLYEFKATMPPSFTNLFKNKTASKPAPNNKRKP
ncbi:MAG: RluA family pseudouridine synthase [Bacilli bacterium]|jgi:23S rRNA pseudouridine1911/1915/1917 synthase